MSDWRQMGRKIMQKKLFIRQAILFFSFPVGSGREISVPIIFCLFNNDVTKIFGFGGIQS